VISSIDPVFWPKETGGDGAAHESSDYHRWASVFSAFTKMRLRFPSNRHPLDEYHHLLWASCTRKEKVALVQLARDGFVNLHNWDACEHLARRGLVQASQADTAVYEIVDKEFCHFVLSEFAEDEVADYVASDEGLPWRTLRRVIFCTFALLLAFVAVSLWEVLGTALGSVLSITAGLTSVVTLLASLRQFAWFRFPFNRASADT
jgi:hypothetical protein